MLQRMNTIAPGPFNVNDQSNPRSSPHKRTATMGSSKDFVRSPSSGSGRSHSQKPSNATSALPSNSLSSISGGPKSAMTREVADSPTLPVMPSLARDLIRDSERPQTSEQTHSFSLLQQQSRSQTFPLAAERHGRSESKSNSRRPSAETAAAAAIRPLDEIGSTSSFKPSKSFKGRRASPTSVNADTALSKTETDHKKANDSPSEKAPSVPRSERWDDPAIMNPYHTPTESNSSNDSSSSDGRSASSMSTPPLSGSPNRPKRRLSNTGHIDHLLQDFRFGTEQVPMIEEPKPTRRNQPPSISFSRPMYPKPADPGSETKETVLQMPESPRDPAIQSARPHLAHNPSDIFAPVVPLENGNLRLSPAPPPPPPSSSSSPTRKPAVANKGSCRGCGELIKGKSVSSADGRLTGRYHRSCFVCKTCQEPFQTADFYVLDNHPYCARHYHQLNGSLCTSCDRGIEGQYLETELKQKFHPHCFTCQDCHRILRDDYFEMNGKTYCEQHAFRAAQQTSLLGPGRRHPERRTTRLMMM